MLVKMYCHSETRYRTAGKKVRLEVDDAAHVAHPADGEKAYPTTPLEIYVAGPGNEAFFQVGKSYFIDVTPADAADPQPEG